MSQSQQGWNFQKFDGKLLVCYGNIMKSKEGDEGFGEMVAYCTEQRNKAKAERKARRQRREQKTRTLQELLTY